MEANHIIIDNSNMVSSQLDQCAATSLSISTTYMQLPCIGGVDSGSGSLHVTHTFTEACSMLENHGLLVWTSYHDVMARGGVAACPHSWSKRISYRTAHHALSSHTL